MFLLFLNKLKIISKKILLKDFPTSASIESCKIVFKCPITHRPVNVIVVLKLFRRFIVKITFSL